MIFFDSIDRDDMVMTDRRCRTGFPNKSFARCRAGRQMCRHHLDCDDSPQRRIISLKDKPHSSPSNDIKDFIRTKASKGVWLIGRLEKVELDG